MLRRCLRTRLESDESWEAARSVSSARAVGQGFRTPIANTVGMPDVSHEPEREQLREVARIEAFSDGVFAIAITLLSLQLMDPLRGDLGAALAARWPNFFALALSYAVIGAYWVFHHRLFSEVVRYNVRLIWLNLLVLFFIVLMPFTTSVLADRGDQPLAVLVYAGSLIGGGLAGAALTAYVFVGHRMCAASVTPRRARAGTAATRRSTWARRSCAPLRTGSDAGSRTRRTCGARRRRRR